MKTIVIEVPHLLSPKVTVWENDDLLNYMRNKSRRCEGIFWRKVNREDLVRDFGDEEEFQNSKFSHKAGALFDSGETEIIERGNEIVCDYLKITDDDGEFCWYAEQEFGDNHWYWMGTPEEARSVKLPTHQEIKTRIALENCLETL